MVDGCASGDSLDFCDLIDSKSPKIAKLHKVGNRRLFCRESVQSFVKCKEVV
jgi:hypothetical protein